MITAPATLSVEKDAAIRLRFSRQGLMQFPSADSVLRPGPGEVGMQQAGAPVPRRA